MFTLNIQKRKTSQAGEGHEFILNRNDQRPALCPRQALLCWIAIGREEPACPWLICDSDLFEMLAPLFFQVSTTQRSSTGASLDQKSILHSFRAHLDEIGVVGWHLYGTHPFRRGGTQY